MNKFNFSELLSYEARTKSLFEKYGLEIKPTSRISQYFSYLRDVNINREKGVEEFNSFLEKNKSRKYFSLFYTSELKSIVDALECTKQNGEIVRNKLDDIAKGTYLLSEESPNDTKSRNTSFELGLFSFLNNLGLRANLGEPNPDLIAKTDYFTYNIECKRPASNENVRRNIKRALKQLRKPTVTEGIPAVAMSLDKILIGDDLIYHSTNEQTAMLGLNRILMNYAIQNKRQLDNICGTQPCVVLYYLSCLAGFQETSLPMAHATYMIGNVYNFEPTISNRIYEDLKRLTI